MKRGRTSCPRCSAPLTGAGQRGAVVRVVRVESRTVRPADRAAGLGQPGPRPGKAPTRFGVLDRLAAAAGAPMPDVVGFTAQVTRGPADGVAAREQALRTAGDLTEPHQRSLRTEASLLATHPPVGRRARTVRGRPHQPATVTMSEAETARIDVELAFCYEKVRARAAEVAYT